MKTETRKCSKCSCEKPLSDFSKRNDRRIQRICKKCGNETLRKWRRGHPSKAAEERKKWRLSHPDKVKDDIRKWRENNPDRMKLHALTAYKKNISTPRGRLLNSIRNGIAHSLRGSKNGKRWEVIVGYTFEKLRASLEKRFKEGMTWENYGSYWHVDHKIPVAAFNFEKPEDLDFKRCWALKNLQPLEAKKNLSKGAKIERPFQPALLI